jgi:hypothetical protein
LGDQAVGFCTRKKRTSKSLGVRETGESARDTVLPGIQRKLAETVQVTVG